MIPLYLLLICQMMILMVLCTDIPEIVNFKVISEQNVEIDVNLMPIPASESFLANENVPVWIPNERFPAVLELEDGVMASLGPFTIYRDPKACAAAVYFHRHYKFDGIVGHHTSIRNLRYDTNTRRVAPSVDTVFPSSILKHDERLTEGEAVDVLEDEGIVGKWDQSLREYPRTVFIETLVIINHDIADELYDHSVIASFVLTLFNNIEMIFSNIRTPHMKFNIAGIVIATTEGSFPKLATFSCYENSDESTKLHAPCALKAMRRTLYEYSEIPFRSYDMAIIFTKYYDEKINAKIISEISKARIIFIILCFGKMYELIERVHFIDGNSSEEGYYEYGLGGLTHAPTAWNSYRTDPQDLTIAIVSRTDIHRLLPVTAHEIAHMFGATHVSGPLWNTDRMCDAHFMKMNKHVCQRCFRFGQKTVRELEEFFGSRQACIFHNQPRSLDPRPRGFWNEKEQCKCYGYPAVHKSRKSTCLPGTFSFCAPAAEVDCNSHLECQSREGKQRTGILMDGTPCDRKRTGTKVCWDGKCIPV